MKNDPFALLGVDAHASKGDLAKAFAKARTRGVSTSEARRAFDGLRDPVAAEAMSILAISQTAGYEGLMSRDENDPSVEAAELMVGVASSVIADLERHLVSDEVLPEETVTRDVRDYVPAPMEELEP